MRSPQLPIPSTTIATSRQPSGINPISPSSRPNGSSLNIKSIMSNANAQINTKTCAQAIQPVGNNEVLSRAPHMRPLPSGEFRAQALHMRLLDGMNIITASRDDNLRVWSLLDSGSVVTPSELIPYETRNFSDTKYYHHLSISPDGKILVVAGASLVRWISVKSERILETVWRAHFVLTIKRERVPVE
ncbi:transducin beta-like protein 2 [Tanacetum coccineum]